jgi:hypothetical protein
MSNEDSKEDKQDARVEDWRQLNSNSKTKYSDFVNAGETTMPVEFSHSFLTFNRVLLQCRDPLLKVKCGNG